MDDRIELAALISEVRKQLVTAVAEGKGSEVAFRAGTVELAVDVVVGWKGGADAGIKAWVISAGTRAEASETATTRLKITLVPIDRDGKDLEVSSIGKH